MSTPENVRKVSIGRRQAPSDPRTPVWRRITAFFGLAFFSVAGGAALAAALGALALVALLLLERAIAG